MFILQSRGYIGNGEIGYKRALIPSIVLTEGIKLLSGDGTKDNAYKIDENPFESGTLAYSIVDNAINSKVETSTIYSPSPKTIPAQEVNGENERTLSITKDDYGNSYYYRGNVQDNYIDFNGMCWRIVRIEGDGSIKLILEDKTKTCKNATGGENSFIGRGTYGYKTEDDIEKFDYLNCTDDSSTCMKNKLETWFNANFTNLKDKLKEDTWYIGDTTNLIDKYYQTGSRLMLKHNATLKETENNFDSYISILTADEVAFAGAKVIQSSNGSGNENCYLHLPLEANKWWRTLTTYRQSSDEAHGTYDVAFCVYQTTFVANCEVWQAPYIRPSIVLNSGINLISGDGTKDNAYKIDENPFESGTLAYNIVNNAINPKEDTSTIYSPVPKTIPAKEVSGENERTLSVTEDTLGRSYYFRGNVIDNYLNFNNMCWRIVRIEGDGSVKLVLQDSEENCNANTSQNNATIGEGTFGYKGDGTITSSRKIDYENCEKDNETCMKKKLDTWFENKFNNINKENYIKKEKWFLGDIDNWYRNANTLIPGYNGQENAYSSTWYRLVTKGTTNLLDNKNAIEDYIGILTADEATLAGTAYSENAKTHYLYLKDKKYWTLSLAYHESDLPKDDKSGDRILIIDGHNGGLHYQPLQSAYLIRPSIVLNKDIKITSGDGTKENPYIIENTN